MAARRAYGTGALRVRADSAGRESWYGQWRCEGHLGGFPNLGSAV